MGIPAKWEWSLCSNIIMFAGNIIQETLNLFTKGSRFLWNLPWICYWVYWFSSTLLISACQQCHLKGHSRGVTTFDVLLWQPLMSEYTIKGVVFKWKLHIAYITESSKKYLTDIWKWQSTIIIFIIHVLGCHSLGHHWLSVHRYSWDQLPPE